MASGTDNLSLFCPRPHDLRVVVHQGVENRQAGHEGLFTIPLSVVGQGGLEQLQADTGLLECLGLVKMSAVEGVEVAGASASLDHFEYPALGSTVTADRQIAGTDDRRLQPDQGAAGPQNPFVELSDTEAGSTSSASSHASMRGAWGARR